MEDTKILELYEARDGEAIAQTKQKYGRYCRAIAYRILQNEADAEEVENDTYLKAWNTIPPSRPSSLKAYLGMIARQLSFDAYEAKNAEKRGGIALVLDELSECLPDAGEGALHEGIALRDALNRFVRSLPEKTQTVFIRRYYYAYSIEEIAKTSHMTESYVTVLMLRTRKKLKKFLEKEGFSV